MSKKGTKRLKVHRSDFGTSSYLTVDGDRVEGVGSVYITTFEEEGQTHASIIFEEGGVDVVDVSPEENADSLSAEVERLKKELARK